METEEASNLPKPPKLIKMIGPSLIILGLGLGSGEILLWPYMSSKFGLGIIWAAVIGITIQFFVNMEITRYTIVKGQSIFVGFAKMSRFLPYWFIFSTLVGWFWPTLIATSAKILAGGFGLKHFDYIAVVALVAIGLILSGGKTAYKAVENFQKISIGLGVPIIFIIALAILTPQDLHVLAKGLVGIGDGYRYIPLGQVGFSLFVFLGAMAYAGAGGNLNLAQSLYAKEKGYGMCKGKKGISKAILNSEDIDLEGQDFTLSKENLNQFSHWWRKLNLEHFFVFLLTGAITIITLSTLAFASAKYFSGNFEGTDFIINESKAIGLLVNPFLGKTFIIVCSLLLFGTQLTVLDSTSRIIAENSVLINRKIGVAKSYYLTVWLQIALGISIFLVGFRDPLLLATISGVINAIAMFIHIGLTQKLNQQALDRSLQPHFGRKLIIFIGWLIFGVLSVYAIINGLKN